MYKPGDILKERYRIIEKIGDGAMGDVYRAEHVTLHREFAIKLMHLHLIEDPDALARFKREASAAAQLDNPHICQVTDFDTTEQGHFYIVMEYLHGETLDNRLERLKTLPLDSIFRIMHDLLDALECAHEHGIVHRDIKPANIMLKQRENRDDYVKLIDFGVAHSSNDEINGITKSGQVFGTPQYLSPEQVMGDPVDQRSDLYAIGCTLYEMIEGTPPFTAEKYIILLNQHLVLAPPHLTAQIEHAQELDAIIQKLLQKDPNHRFSSALELRETLDQVHNPYRLSLDMHVPVPEPEPVPSVSNISIPQVQSHVTNPEIMLPIWESLGGLLGIRNRKRIGAVAVARSIVLVLLAAALLNMFWQQKQFQNKIAEQAKEDDDTEEQQMAVQPQAVHIDDEENAQKDASLSREQIHDAPNDDAAKQQMLVQPQAVKDDKEEPQEDAHFTLSREQIHDYAKTECRIASDIQLTRDENIRVAAEHCLLENYTEAHQSLEAAKKQYQNNIHFITMLMLDEFALNHYDDVIENIIELFKVDAAAVCDPTIRDIIYSLIEDNVYYEKLQNSFKKMDSKQAAEGLAWLILMTPCNHYQTRFERLMKCFDAINKKNTEKWIDKAINAWGPYQKSKETCDDRQIHVDHYVLDGLDDFCSNRKNASKARCAMCRNVWQDRANNNAPVPRED